MKILNKKNLIFLFSLIYFLPSVSLAADIFFSTSKNVFTPDEDFVVQVYLDTEDKVVNALEGVIEFPTEFLELKEIRDGNSSINFWIEKPYSVVDGKISFSGITTGGFSGSDRFLFGMVFRSKKIGSSSINFNNIKVLQNDGLGTKISTTSRPFSLTILSDVNPSDSRDLTVIDTNPPEDFNPSVGSDPEIFSGQHFLVFSTVDKGVGIDRYEVREGFLGKYIVAESPYLLEDQSLKRNIYIKAIDKYENERLVKLEAQNPPFWLESYFIFAIILVICLFSCIFYRKKIWQKFIH